MDGKIMGVEEGKKRCREYILMHRRLVKEGLEKLRPWIEEFLNADELGLLEENVKCHDDSKFGEDEFLPRVMFYHVEKSESAKKALFEAEEKHKTTNKHHHEYWQVRGQEMPRVFVVEMVLDWWTFGLRENNPREIFDYYDQNKKALGLTKTEKRNVEAVLKMIESFLKKDEPFAMHISAKDLNEYFAIQGRVYLEKGVLFMNHTLSLLEGRFVGNFLDFDLAVDYGKDKYAVFVKVFVDGVAKKYRLKRGQNHIRVSVADGAHNFRLVKLTESKFGSLGVEKVSAQKFEKVKRGKKIKLEFVGDSITAGYGIMSREEHGKYFSVHQDPTKNFVFKVASALDADFNVIAASGHGVFETNDADVGLFDLYENVDLYRNTKKWNENKFCPDIEIVELGLNDFIHFKTLEGKEYEAAVERFENRMVEFASSCLAKKRKIVFVDGFFGFKNLKTAMQNVCKRLGSRNVFLVETVDINDIGDLHAWHPGRRTNTITAKRILKVFEKNNLCKKENKDAD